MMRPLQRPLLTRIWLASSAVVLAACLAAADEAPNPCLRAAAMGGPATDGPTKFDFMVFASMADSPRLLAMAGYRPAPRQGAAHPAADTVAGPAAGSRLPQCRL